eukprot:Rmarinus@m.5201
MTNLELRTDYKTHRMVWRPERHDDKNHRPKSAPVRRGDTSSTSRDRHPKNVSADFLYPHVALPGGQDSNPAYYPRGCFREYTAPKRGVTALTPRDHKRPSLQGGTRSQTARSHSASPHRTPRPPSAPTTAATGPLSPARARRTVRAWENKENRPSRRSVSDRSDVGGRERPHPSLLPDNKTTKANEEGGSKGSIKQDVVPSQGADGSREKDGHKEGEKREEDEGVVVVAGNSAKEGMGEGTEDGHVVVEPGDTMG